MGKGSRPSAGGPEDIMTKLLIIGIDLGIMAFIVGTLVFA